MKIQALASLALIGLVGCGKPPPSSRAEEIAREYAQHPAHPRVTVSTECTPDSRADGGVSCVETVEVEC